MSTAHAELAAAMARVNDLYQQLPEAARPRLSIRWDRRDRALDRAFASGDEGRALAAVAEWEREAKLTIARALLHAPLEIRR
jgi:hypothetical protein